MDSGAGYQYELSRDESVHSDDNNSGVVKQLVEKFKTLEAESKDDVEEQLAALHEQRRSQEWKYRNPGSGDQGMYDDDNMGENGGRFYGDEANGGERRMFDKGYGEDDQEWRGSGGLYENGSGMGSKMDGSFFDGGADGASERGSVVQDTYQAREPAQPLLEWRRKRAIELREKEVAEDAARRRLMEDGHDYIDRFRFDRTRATETAHTNNKRKEDMLMAELENLHVNADKNYWAAVLELIDFNFNRDEENNRTKPKSRKPKEIEIPKAPGGKPGKATDLGRMRQVLLKLKHHPVKSLPVPRQEPKKAAAK